MTTAIHFVRELSAMVWRVWTSPANASRFIAFALCTAAWLLWRRYRRHVWPSLSTRDAGTDALYTAMYLGGIYSFFIAGPVLGWLERLATRHAPYLQMNVLRGTSALTQILAVSLTLDFTGYWVHRLCHTNRLLWSFHRIHHSQTELSPLTSYRFHPAEMVLRGIASLIPGIVLGPATTNFAIAVAIDTTLSALVHSGETWTFGPLGWLFVNPRFHRLHHARDARLHQGNYSITWCVWDRLFGTRIEAADANVPLGVDEEVPRAFFAQQFDPFFAAVKPRRPSPDPVPVALELT